MQNMAIKKNDIRSAGRCRAALALALCVGAAAFAETPDKWVSYVESAGSSWVDTGIIGRWNTKIECKVEWMNLADSAFISCGDWQNNTRFYPCYCYDNAGRIIVSQGTNVIVKLSNGWESRWEKSRVYDVTTTFSATNAAGQSTASIAVDGYSGWSRAEKGLDTGVNLYVFANNRGGGNVGGKSRSRCYGLKIWQGPIDGGDMVLVRDFQPCMKDGRAGLYDAVSETIFYSITESDLICDANSEVPDEYIEYVEAQGEEILYDSQKPAYIDTGIIGKSGTKMSGEFALLASEDRSVLDSRAGNNRFYMLHSFNSKFTCGYGTHKDNTLTLQLGQKYWVETELNAGKQTQKIAVGGVTNTVLNATDSQSIDTGYPLYLFSCNVDGSPTWFSKARCYGLKIWQNGNLVRDFRPCLKNGVAGLYDDVSKRIFYSLGTPLVFNNVCRQSVKPKEVVYVEYIESDGNNTLDTGIPAKSGLRAAGDMAWMGPKFDNDNTHLRSWEHESYRYLENTAAAPVFYRQQHGYLCAVKASDGSRFFMLHAMDRCLDVGYGQSGEINPKRGGDKIIPTIGTKYSFNVTLANGSQTVKWGEAGQNLETVLSTNMTGNVDAGTSLYLFSSSYWRHRSATRCYGLKIWDGNTLVRDFKPCIVDGKGMLYDEVTEAIYRPSPDIPESRTGKVVFPEGVTKPANYVEYVETDGKVFVDTGVIGKAATTAEFKETSMQKSTSEECFLGSYGGSSDTVSRFYMWYHAWGYNVGLGYGTYYRPKKNDPYTDAENSSDPDVYVLNPNDTTHARVSFAVGSQTFSAIDDATGTVTLYSSKTVSTDVNTGRTLYLFAKHDSDAGTPTSPAASRFYFLKLWQGNSDGTNMRLVRDYRPVRLTNGLVVLWDFANNEPFVAKSTTAPYNDTTFPVVGPDGAAIVSGSTIFVR